MRHCTRLMELALDPDPDPTTFLWLPDLSIALPSPILIESEEAPPYSAHTARLVKPRLIPNHTTAGQSSARPDQLQTSRVDDPKRVSSQRLSPPGSKQTSSQPLRSSPVSDRFLHPIFGLLPQCATQFPYSRFYDLVFPSPALLPPAFYPSNSCSLPHVPHLDPTV
jgi:hypothetical protein